MPTIKDTITLEDAIRLTGPSKFNIMIKPAGSLCNLDCHYCYYLDKSEIYGGKEPRMSLEMLEKSVREYIEANDSRHVCFNWHGGEPLILGLDFYRKAVEFERKYASGKEILNTIQTNGVLINDEFAAFFKDNNFLVGVSIDGPEDVHDRYRKDKNSSVTFSRVIRGIETLYRHGVDYNAMTTVNKASEGRGLEIYTFLKGLGTRFIQFLPVVEHVKWPQRPSGKPLRSGRPVIVSPYAEGAEIAAWSVRPREYGKFLIEIFDYWVRNDVGKWFVDIFDNTLANWCGAPTGSCVFAETCGGNSVLEHNGDLYCCDHFVYPQFKLGNIFETPLRELMKSPLQTSFGIGKRNNLPSKCAKCHWWFCCHGECPKHRFNKTESGETGLNVLCEGYSAFFAHSAPYMEKMRELVFADKAPAEIMSLLRSGAISG